MQCKDAEKVLGALIDGEGAGERQQAAAEHIAGCPQCTALANDYRHVGETLRAVAYVPAPAGFEAKVRARLAAEALAAAQAAAQAASGRWWFDAGRWMQQAAALVVVAGLAALVSWHLTRTAADQDRQQRDVLAAHVRSLLQEATIQIASSERHLVRPWFNGRVEFAPGVKDLAAQGFSLLGGRLDWIAGRRVATLVYKRRLHVINVFMWPADAQGDEPPRAIGLKGYNAISWTSAGMAHWAISDLNAKELAELQALF